MKPILPILFAVFCYIIGYFNLSIIFIVSLTVLTLMVMQKQDERMNVKQGIEMQQLLNDNLTKSPEILKKIIQHVPEWIQSKDKSNAQFLNELIAGLWKHIDGAVADSVRTSVEPILESSRPTGITEMSFASFSLGTIPPTITGLKVVDTAAEDGKIVLYLNDLKMSLKPNIDLLVKLTGMPLHILVDELVFVGSVRIELSPLVPVWPCFGRVGVSFVNKPYLDLSITPGGSKSIDLMSVPGISGWLSDTIDAAIDLCMVYPTQIMTPILENMDMILASSTPVGKLEINIEKAQMKKVKKSLLELSKPDYYCEVTLLPKKDKVHTSKTCWNKVDPFWNFNVSKFILSLEEEYIRVTVYDKDLVTANNYIGQADIRLTDMKHKPEGNDMAVTLLNTKKMGKERRRKIQKGETIDGVAHVDDIEVGIITYSYVFQEYHTDNEHDDHTTPAVVADEGEKEPSPISGNDGGNKHTTTTTAATVTDATTDAASTGDGTTSGAQQPEGTSPSTTTTTTTAATTISPTKYSNRGVLVVRQIRGMKLRAADFSTKSSDPYCVVTYRDKKEKTNIRSKNLNPEWNDLMWNFDVQDIKEDVIKFDMFDYDMIGGDDFLGSITIAVSDVAPIDKGNNRVKKTFTLMPMKDSKGGQITVDFEIKRYRERQ